MTPEECRRARTRATNKISNLRRDEKAIQREIVTLELRVASIDEHTPEPGMFGDVSIVTAGDPS